MYLSQKDKNKIRSLVMSMLNESHVAMMKNIDKVLDSGVINEWNENDSPMITPKCIITALLQRESTQYEGKGTSFEKEIKNTVRKIRYFL